MPRPIWSGAISFGLVNVPVRLFSATEQKDIRFHQFDRESGERVRIKRVTEDSGNEVEYDDIVKGYELKRGRHVLVTPEELESVDPQKTRTIDVEDFIDFTEIDPIHYEKTYYLEPGGGEGAKRAYALLRDAMAASGRVAIGRFVMRTKEYLAAIRPAGSMLYLETMFFPDEVRDPGSLDVPGKIKLSAREREIAAQLVESLTQEWDPDRYRDTYREAVLDLVKRKDKGEDVVVEAEAKQSEPVTDLLAALEASIDASKKQRTTTKKPAAKKAARSTRKSTAKKRRSPNRS